MAILQSNELFIFNQAIGFLLLLVFFAIYISIGKPINRYIFFLAGWPVFYILTGGFSMPVILLCILHELLFRKQGNRYIISGLYIIAGVLVIFISARVIFYIPQSKIFKYPVVSGLNFFFQYTLIFFFIWTPLVIIVSFFLNKSNSLKSKLLSWNLTNILAGILVIVLMGFVVYKYAYNRKAEMMLGIDYHVQQAEWRKVLKLSERYPGYNTLVIYYTNLALLNTGQLGEKIFSYPQIGSKGLRLKWERNQNLFFGGEIFYYLAYINEAYHWAFEALVAKGMNPRSLKRLVITSIINGHNEIAKKYLNILQQSTFYCKWAKKYDNYLSNPLLIEKDPTMSYYRDLLVNHDFISNANDLNLEDLLENHPGNKMAFEYFLASLLLDKNLDAFAENFVRIKDFRYTSIPLAFEEALLFYNFYERKNIAPEGFSFRPETITRFNDYATTYTKFRSDLPVAAFQLRKKHEKTFWYYLQFYENR